MTTPVVESVTTTAFGAGPGPHAVAMPATVNSGELLVIFFGCSYASSITNPAGWTEKWDQDVSSNSRRSSCHVKVADGTEDGTTVSITVPDGDQAAAHTYRISGWYGTLAGVEVGTAATGTDDSPNPPSLTPSWGSADQLFLVSAVYKGDFTTTSSYPTNYTNGTTTKSAATDSGDEVSVATARRAVTGTTDNPGVYTLSGSANWVANTLVVRPTQVTAPVVAIAYNIIS